VIAADASAVLAILLGEEEAPRVRGILEQRGALISPVNHWEILVRAHTAGGAGAIEAVRALFAELSLQVASISGEDSEAAFGAFRRFGKGQGGPLNLGDCFAYALAEREGEGLLFKGDDFPKTDVKPTAGF
jgi:ribonuclease VapC